MIRDKIKYYNEYDRLPNDIKKGLEYIFKTDFSKLEDGRHELFGENYINIQTYTTKDDADFEAHREYVDIQYIISGEEQIGVTSYDNCKTTIEYNPLKDIEFLSGEGTYFTLKEGEFMILYPEDAHKPSIKTDVPSTVRKAVAKIKLST
jgi:YhcH/YjgK/YiaL family protein